ncbi:Wzt carbohydrate-binding domain-containing protein [Blastopirellula marina]
MKYGAMNSIGPVEEIATQYCQEQQRDATSRHIEFAQPMHHQKFVLRAATVVDLESQPSDRAQPLRSGSPLAIRVFFDAHESMQCIELQVELRDTQGTLVASFHTFLTEDAPAVGKGKYSWTCEIRELWLAEGDYFVSITAKDMCKTCDDKPSCLKFTIEGSRFNRFTRSVGQKYGTLCVPQTWQLDPIASNI